MTSVTSFQGRKGIVTMVPADYVSLKDSTTHKVTGSSINDLADVDLSIPPTDGQVLVYSTAGGLNKWIAGAASGGGMALTDLSATAPLTYNSSTGAFAITAATTSDPGSLSAADKTKLDGLTAIPTTGDGLVERFSSSIGMKTCSVGEFLVWYSVTGWTCTTGVSLPGTSTQTLGMTRNTTSDTAGNALTIQASGATTAATDKDGGGLVLSAGASTGTGASLISFQTATASGAGTTDNAPTTKMVISGNGNVGIGTSTPSAKLTVTGGQALVSYYNASTATTLDFNNGNMQGTGAAAGTITLSNMLAGGTYTVILTNATGGTYTLSASGYTFRCQPTCTSNQVIVNTGAHTVMSILATGSIAYVSWMRGF